MTMAMAEILENTSKIRGKRKKIDYLRQHYSKQMHEVLAYGYHPAIQFLLPLIEDDESEPPYTELGLDEVDNPGRLLYKEARRLYLFVRCPQSANISQVQREQQFINFLGSIHPKDAKMMLKIVRKKPPFKGITKELVEEAYGVYNG